MAWCIFMKTKMLNMNFSMLCRQQHTWKTCTSSFESWTQERFVLFVNNVCLKWSKKLLQLDSSRISGKWILIITQDRLIFLLLAEYWIYIDGRRRSEWDDLASRILSNKLHCNMDTDTV